MMPSWTPACLKILEVTKRENGGGAYSRQVAPDEEFIDDNGNGECRQGTATVELNKKERSTLGLIISGGIDKGTRPKIANLRPGGLAYRSDSLCVGDVILSINGIRTGKLKHEEIVNLLKNAEEKVLLEVEYDLPYSALETSPSICSKVIQIRLEKENGNFGFVLRGGANVGCPLTVTYVRPGGPADREGTVKSGDRLLAVDNYNLNNIHQNEVATILRQIEHEAMFTVEYDVSLMEAVRNASGPLLVEIERGSNVNQQLGVALSSSPKDSSSILIQSIKQASLAERCGALHVGDQVLAIDDVSLDVTATAAEASQLLRNSCGDRIRLEILPLSQMLFGKRIPEVNIRNATASTSLSSFATLGSNYRNQPQSLRNPSWRLQRSIEQSPSSTSLPSCISSCSAATAPSPSTACTQVCRPETTKVTLNATDHRGFGLALCNGTNSLSLMAPPIIGSLDPGGVAERTGIMQVGDRILSINGVPTDGFSLEEVTHMISASKPRVVLHIEFDVAESVVPSSGIFEVRLPRKIYGGLGITISMKKDNHQDESPVISEVRSGSVTHRTGTIQVGDKLLAIGAMKIDDRNLDEVHQLLKDSREDVLRLRIQKGSLEDDNISDFELTSKEWTSSAVELSRRGSGPLGITVSGSDEPCRPILISALTEGGLAQRSGLLYVGDRLLAINGSSTKGRTLGQVIKQLQNSTDSVTLKVARKRNAVMSMLGDSEERDETSSKCGGTPLPSIDSAVESWDSEEAGSHLGLLPPFGVRRRSGPSQGTPTLSMEGDREDAERDIEEEEEEEGENEQQDLGEVRAENWPNSPCHSSNGSHPGEDDEPDQNWIKILSEFGAKEMTVVNLPSTSDCVVPNLRRRMSDENLAARRQGSCGLPDSQELPPALHSNTLPHSCTRTGRSKVGTSGSNAAATASSPANDDESAAPYPIEVHRVTLFKDTVYEDFGFSVSDGLYERGVYVNRIRPGGPADIGGILRSFDRILQVNETKTHDFDCCLTVPLIAAAGDRIHLVVIRNPYTGMRPSRGGGANVSIPPALTVALPWMEEEEREATPCGPNTIVKSL